MTRTKRTYVIQVEDGDGAVGELPLGVDVRLDGYVASLAHVRKNGIGKGAKRFRVASVGPWLTVKEKVKTTTVISEAKD